MSYVRDIIDDIVKKNSHLNPEYFDNALKYPPYFGSVRNTDNKVVLVSADKDCSKSSLLLIGQIVDSFRQFAIADEEAYIINTDTGEKVSTTPNIIKFIKTALACSISECEEFSIAVAAFIKYVINNIGNLTLPAPIEDMVGNTPLQKEALKELNTFFMQLCTDEGVTFKGVVQSNSNGNPLVKALTNQ